MTTRDTLSDKAEMTLAFFNCATSETIALAVELSESEETRLRGLVGDLQKAKLILHPVLASKPDIVAFDAAVAALGDLIGASSVEAAGSAAAAAPSVQAPGLMLPPVAAGKPAELVRVPLEGRGRELSTREAPRERTAGGSSVRVIDETTLITDAPYDVLFNLGREVASGLGGKLKSEDVRGGRLDFKFRYGINPTGIRVTIQFRRAEGGDTEMVVHGRIGDSLDVTGAGKARGSTILNGIVARLEGGRPYPDVLPAEPHPVRAPILGTMGAPYRGKSKTQTTLLALLLGGLGVHRFYLGTWGIGLIYLGLSLIGMGAFGFPLGVVCSIYDLLRFMLMKTASFDAKFNYAKVGPFTF